MSKGFLKALDGDFTQEGRRYRVDYFLELETSAGLEALPLNDKLGQAISLRFTGNIQCQGCKSPIKKIFQTGVCFRCAQKLARCDLCIVKPERCHFHQGTCREPDWGEAHCMQDHVVYLANSSGIKVGITRVKNIPMRWIDQGAIQALPILKTSSRRLSGLIEVEIAKQISDRTNWRKMLKNEVEWTDLSMHRDRMLSHIQPALAQIANLNIGTIAAMPNAEPYEFEYPVLKYPTQILSRSFDKTPVISGEFLGVKGQYLLLDGEVLNLGKFAGYELVVSFTHFVQK